jgi:hypothetical protein
VRVHWTNNAVDRLVNIFDVYLSKLTHLCQTNGRHDHPSYDATMQISDQPYSGRKVPEYQAEDVRELIE